jgi:hypothetical protein
MTLNEIKAMCIEDGDCLIWQGYVNGSTPMVRYEGKKVGVRRILLKASGVVVRSPYVGSRCLNPLCVCPEHAVQRSKEEQGRAACKNSNTADQKVRVALAAKRRAKHPQHVVDGIRSDEGRIRDIAARWGVSPEWARRIRLGTGRAELSNPFAGLGG